VWTGRQGDLPLAISTLDTSEAVSVSARDFQTGAPGHPHVRCKSGSIAAASSASIPFPLPWAGSESAIWSTFGVRCVSSGPDCIQLMNHFGCSCISTETSAVCGWINYAHLSVLQLLLLHLASWLLLRSWSLDFCVNCPGPRCSATKLPASEPIWTRNGFIISPPARTPSTGCVWGSESASLAPVVLPPSAFC